MTKPDLEFENLKLHIDTVRGDGLVWQSFINPLVICHLGARELWELDEHLSPDNILGVSVYFSEPKNVKNCQKILLSLSKKRSKLYPFFEWRCPDCGIIKKRGFPDRTNMTIAIKSQRYGLNRVFREETPVWVELTIQS